MQLIQTSRVFYEQTKYPEFATCESWIKGLKDLPAIYVYQLDIREQKVTTHWGVIRRLPFKEPDLEKHRKALVGAIAIDYGLDGWSFQVVKRLPAWELSAEGTIAFELKNTPALVYDNFASTPVSSPS